MFKITPFKFPYCCHQYPFFLVGFYSPLLFLGVSRFSIVFNFHPLFYLVGCGSIISFEKPGKISVRGSDQQPKKCRWLSTPSTLASSNDVISFHFTYFDVPCRHGYVTLHDRNGGKKEDVLRCRPPTSHQSSRIKSDNAGNQT